MTRTPRRRRSAAALALGGLALTGTACGTRLDDTQIAADVAAVSGGQAVAIGADQGAAPGSGSAAGGTEGAAALPGTDSGGGSAGSGGTGATSGAGSTTGGAGDGSPGGGSGTGGSSGGSAGTGGTAAGGSAGATGGTSGASAGGPGAAAPGQPTGPLLLGNVGDYSGLSSSSTAGSLRGVQVWVQAVNARGGIGGRKVKLLVADAGGDGQRAKGFVQDFVEDKKVTALVGSAAALSVSAWASYVDGKKVPAVGGDCGAVYWNQHPMLFNQCPALETSLYGILANGVADKGKGAKWADLYCVESPDLCGKLDALANGAGYAKKAGLDPVYRSGISLGQPDFTSECLNLRNAGAQVVSVFADANTTQRVARSCSQQDYRPVFLSGSIQAPSNAPTSAGLEDVELMVQTLPFAGVSTPAYAEYKAAIDRFADGQTGVGEMNGWVAGKLFERAVQLGGGTSTPQVVAGLLAMERETLGGLSTPLTFLAGKPAPDSRCWYRMQAKNGKWTAPGEAKPSCWAGA